MTGEHTDQGGSTPTGSGCARYLSQQRKSKNGCLPQIVCPTDIESKNSVVKERVACIACSSGKV